MTHLALFILVSKTDRNVSLPIPLNISVIAVLSPSRVSDWKSGSFPLIYSKKKKSLGAKFGLEGRCVAASTNYAE
jgi:hypothetical protein